MFKVTDSHIDAFGQERTALFATRMMERLKRAFSQELATQQITEADLPLLVKQGIELAASYGVLGEMDVALFIECMVLLSRRFDLDPRFPWAGKCLRRSDIDGTQKMDIIHDHLVFGASRAQ